MRTYSNQTVGVTYGGPGISSDTSAEVYINPNDPETVQILAPGEIAQPGNGASRRKLGCLYWPEKRKRRVNWGTLASVKTLN